MFDGKKIDFLLKFSVYIQYYLPVLTMFLDEWNNILVIYLDFRYLCGLSNFLYVDYHWQYTTCHITIGLA